MDQNRGVVNEGACSIFIALFIFKISCLFKAYVSMCLHQINKSLKSLSDHYLISGVSRLFN